MYARRRHRRRRRRRHPPRRGLRRRRQCAGKARRKERTWAPGRAGRSRRTHSRCSGGGSRFSSYSLLVLPVGNVHATPQVWPRPRAMSSDRPNRRSPTGPNRALLEHARALRMVCSSAEASEGRPGRRRNATWAGELVHAVVAVARVDRRVAAGLALGNRRPDRSVVTGDHCGEQRQTNQTRGPTDQTRRTRLERRILSLLQLRALGNDA